MTKTNQHVKVVSNDRPIADEDIDILARTIFGEARGEWTGNGVASFIAIANVVMNRVRGSDFFGKTIKEVCQKPWQFSCWNRNDPNLVQIQNVTRDQPIFNLCWEVASNVAHDLWLDVTKGATHYYSVFLKQPPSWVRNMVCTAHIGNHIFFKEV